MSGGAWLSLLAAHPKLVAALFLAWLYALLGAVRATKLLVWLLILPLRIAWRVMIGRPASKALPAPAPLAAPLASAMPDAEGKPPAGPAPPGELELPPPAPRRPGMFRRAYAGVRFLLFWSAVIGPFVAIGVGGWLVSLFLELPSFDQIEKVANNLEFVVDKQGERLTFVEAKFTLQARLDTLPPYVKDALMTMEDRHFYEHWGMDWRGPLRSVQQVLTGRSVGGGSTLTQQLAKNLFFSQERTATRKIKEMLLALKLEWYYSKDQILEMYLNRVHFGNGMNGVEQASRFYFSKRARELNLYETALLVGSIPRPAGWNLLKDERKARERAELVLKKMVEQGRLEKMPPARSLRVQEGDRKWQKVDLISLFEAIRPEVLEKAKGQDGQLHVITTLDPDVQVYAELAVRRKLAAVENAKDVHEAGLVALSPDGVIRALVATADRGRCQLNHALGTRRQLGSTFKPLVYLAALAQGRRPEDRISAGRLTLDGWSPRNADEQYPASETLTEALAHSHNTATIRLLQTVGRAAVLNMARAVGLDARLPEGMALALGTGEGTLLSVTKAYATFASGGLEVDPYLVVGIRSKQGKILAWRKSWRWRPPVLEHGLVGMLNQMLAEAVEHGTGRKARFGKFMVAGKTGTTQDSRDAYFVGYSAQLAAGVWVGNDDNHPMLGISGSNLPAEIWANFMANAHESLELAPKALPGLEIK